MTDHHMKYVVTLASSTVNEDTTGWLLENLGPRSERWEFDPGFYMNIRFEHEEDAAVFKLRWL